MMHKVCLQRQETFDGSLPHNCVTGPVNEEMRSFFNVVIRGRSALCGRVMVSGDANLDPRDKIACNISQLLIFNVVKGKYHTVNTPAVRHSNERETPFSLYRGLGLHRHGRDKNRSGLTKTMVSRHRIWSCHGSKARCCASGVCSQCSR